MFEERKLVLMLSVKICKCILCIYVLRKKKKKTKNERMINESSDIIVCVCVH